jgi:DNA primase
MSTEQRFSLPSKKRRASLDKAANQYAECVDLAEGYLQSRGLTRETMDEWGLGFVLDPLPGHEDFQNRLAIPYLTPTGCVDMRFRCLSNHDCKEVNCPKYLGESGSQRRLFGVRNLALDTPIIGLCEGELDAIAATAAGLPSIGVSGAKGWKNHWNHVFEGYTEIVILSDGDSAGKQLAEHASGVLYNSRVAAMPQGEDVSSFIQKNGVAKFLERVGVDSEPDSIRDQRRELQPVG